MKQNHSTAVRQMNVPHIQKHFSVPQFLYLFTFLQSLWGKKLPVSEIFTTQSGQVEFQMKDRTDDIGNYFFCLLPWIYFSRRSEGVFILFPLHKGTVKAGDVPTQSRAPPSGSCNCCTKTLLPPLFSTEPLLWTCLFPPLSDKSETKTWFSGGLGWINGWTRWSLPVPFNSGYSKIPWSWRSFPA